MAHTIMKWQILLSLPSLTRTVLGFYILMVSFWVCSTAVMKVDFHFHLDGGCQWMYYHIHTPQPDAIWTCYMWVNVTEQCMFFFLNHLCEALSNSPDSTCNHWQLSLYDFWLFVSLHTHMQSTHSWSLTLSLHVISSIHACFCLSPLLPASV